MTHKTLNKISDINGRIRATAELLAERGDIRNADGRSLATTITDLFALLREVEAEVFSKLKRYEVQDYLCVECGMRGGKHAHTCGKLRSQIT